MNNKMCVNYVYQLTFQYTTIMLCYTLIERYWVYARAQYNILKQQVHKPIIIQ